MSTRTHHCRRGTTRLQGEVDLATAPAIKAALVEYARRLPGPVVVIDCRDLEFIDSSGLQMLVEVATSSSKSIRLVNVAPPIRRVFELTGLRDRFGIT